MIMDVLRTNGPQKILFALKDFEVKIWLQPSFSCFSSYISLYSPTVLSNNWVFSMSPEPLLHCHISRNLLLPTVRFFLLFCTYLCPALFRTSSCFTTSMKPFLVVLQPITKCSQQ